MSDTESTSQDTPVQSLQKIFPQRLSDNYKKIQSLLRPARIPTFDKESDQMDAIVSELEELLNDSLPNNDAEQFQRIQECLHFHRDPVGYYQHINDAKLRFLVLWTDYKAITNHFRIRNIIHVRWTGSQYECQRFDKSKRVKQLARLESRNEATGESRSDTRGEYRRTDTRVSRPESYGRTRAAGHTVLKA